MTQESVILSNKRLCACGKCNEIPKEGKKFVQWHNARVTGDKHFKWKGNAVM